MRGLPHLWLAALAVSPTACAGSGRAAADENPEYIDGVRQRPLEAAEVGRALNAHTPRFRACYQKNRFTIGLDAPSDFVARLRVPNDGEASTAEIIEATQSGQDELERCVVQALESLRFPPHVGEALIVDVPIRAPKR